ncbi:MAG: HAMP domain-containing histidine kinase [Oscillospiraceae bacterium]|nr:HAMP domain-containing histidine kinase [Oscillospiraceae bacterium]
MKLIRNADVRRELLVAACLCLAISVPCFVFLGPWAGGAVLLAGAVQIALRLFEAARRHREMEKLAQSLDAVLHGQGTLLADCREGELAILKSEIEKLTVLLREDADELRQAKLNLTGSIQDIFHQIRTPLTSMGLTASLLQKEDLGYEERLELVRDLERQLRRIRWLTENLLKLSRLDAGVVTFHREDMALADLVRAACGPLEIALELRGVELRLNIGQERLACDRDWTLEAVSNLVKNSMEHTPQGGRVTLTGRETPIFTELTVEDTGPGFHKEDLPHVFERFYRGKNAAPDSIGIGLAMARAVAAGQNGTLKAENRREGGARFILRFYKATV